MKNLYNSPFEYWEKIGYVGYNNYTDLHLNVKIKNIVASWNAESSSQEKKNQDIRQPCPKSRIKNNIHFLSFIFYNFLKSIHTQSFILKKILFFFSTWKKKYAFFIKKNIKHRLIKFYMLFFLNKIVSSYLISLKRWHKLNLFTKKRKLYEYLSVLYNIPGTKKKIFFFKKILKSLTKNYTFSTKHMPFFNSMFSDHKKTNLYRPQYLYNRLSIENSRYEEKGLFKNIPLTVNNHVKKELTLFICTTFNVTVYQIRKILSTNTFGSWKDFFYFLHYRSKKARFASVEESFFDLEQYKQLTFVLLCAYVYKKNRVSYITDVYDTCAHLVE